MRPDRFAALAEAYGADLARWPRQETEAAERHLASCPGARAALTEAAWLDASLDSFRVAPPASELQRRVVTSLLQRRAKRGLRWLSGVGAMGALGAGAAAGAMAISISMPAHPEPEGVGPLYEQSMFGDVMPPDAVAAPPAART